MMRKGVLWLLPLIVGGTVSAASDYQRWQLPNGIIAYGVEDHTAPLTALIAVVHCGSAVESESEAGMTHLLEHLLFDGTERYTQKTLAHAVDQVGGYFNAFTRKDYALYMVVTPSEALNTAMDIQSDMLFHAAVPLDQLEKERKVVLEEIGQGHDNQMSAVEELLERTVLGSSAYGRPILGEPRIISSVSREKIMAYYKKWYVPNNVTLILIGDFQPAAAQQALAGYYGKVPAGTTVSQETLPQQVLPEGQSFVRTSPGNNPQLELIYPAPAVLSVDDRLFDALDALLNGPGGVLKQLQHEFENIKQISGSIVRYRRISYYRISMTLAKPDFTVIEEALSLKLAEWSNKFKDEDALANVKTSLAAKRLLDGERFDHRAWDYAEYEVFGDIDARSRYEAELATVSLADITNAISYFDPARMIRVHLFPQQTKDRSETLPTTDGEFGYRRLENGMTIIAKSNPYLEVAAVSLLVAGRTLAEPIDQPGISDITTSCLLKGAGGRSSDDIEKLLEQYGMQIQVTDDPFVPFDDYYFSPDYVSIRLEMPSPSFNVGLDLLGDMIQRPTFPADGVKEVLDEAQTNLSRLTKKPSEKGWQALYRGLFSGSSYGNPLRGTLESLSVLTPEMLQKHWGALYQPARVVAAVVGNLPVEALLQAVASRFETWPKPLTESKLQWPETAMPVEKINLELKSAQTFLVWGRYLALSSRADRAVVQVLASALSDRMNAEIREQHGLAYSLGAGVQTAPGFCLLTISAGTSPENRQQVIDLVTTITQSMKQTELKLIDLERLKNTIKGQRLRYRQRRINQAHFLALAELLGFGYTDDDAFDAALGEVTALQVLEQAQAALDFNRFTQVIVGPRMEE